jgi:hypothetical protein
MKRNVIFKLDSLPTQTLTSCKEKYRAEDMAQVHLSSNCKAEFKPWYHHPPKKIYKEIPNPSMVIDYQERNHPVF